MIVAHGIDIVSVERIGHVLDAHGERFLERCFTSEERAMADVPNRDVAAQRLAARFAAKEAVLKALGTGLTGGIQWRDVAVVRDVGPPRVELRGRAAEAAASWGITHWHLSLSHAGGLAMASVIGTGSRAKEA